MGRPPKEREALVDDGHTNSEETPKKSKARQKRIPGTFDESESKLIKLAEDYEEIKNERCALSVKEREAKQAVEDYMIANKIKQHRINEKTLLVIEEGKKKLKIVKTEDAADDE